MGIFGKRRTGRKGDDEVATGQGLDSPTQVPIPEALLPGDETVWELISFLNNRLPILLESLESCQDTAKKAENAEAVARMEFVNGVRQHDMSKAAFAERAKSLDQALSEQLRGLRDGTEEVRPRWEQLTSLTAGGKPGLEGLTDWMISRRVDGGIVGTVFAYSFIFHTNYGDTRSTFWAENERVNKILEAANE